MQIDGYKILEKIGQGGMAQVYKAHQVSLNRPVAIKVLTHNFSDKKDFIQRFEKESLIIARLSNPFIIPVFERGLTVQGVPYFIMEYVEGQDLGRVMDSEHLDFNRKLDISIQICKALSYAHRNNVIHRDIKPANVLIDNDGNARILDFGIAQYYEEDNDKETTKVGAIMGTMAYMSPEQRQSATAVTFRSDLFSLGVLMYKFFTRQDPVGRFKTPEQLVPEIPTVLSELILKCLEHRPEDRPSSADEIKDSLLLLLRGAHLQTEQRERVQKDFKQFDLLDVIKDDQHSSVMLFENRSSKKLIIIKKRSAGHAGLKEAQLLTPLKHQNIARILGTSENQRNYIIVMEYLNGGNLQERLVQPLNWREFIPLAREMACGLNFAHSHNIVHGNLRPSNILFSNNGQVKIVDFGLQEHYSNNNLDKNWYRPDKEPDSPEVDIFAMGVIFYQMLVGMQPNLEDDCFAANITFKKLPTQLKQLIVRMLHKNPQQRIGSFSEVHNELNAISTTPSDTIVIAKKPPQARVKKSSRSRLGIMILLILSLILFMAAWLIDLQALQYFFEDLFFPQEEQQQQYEFIDLTWTTAVPGPDS